MATTSSNRSGTASKSLSMHGFRPKRANARASFRVNGSKFATAKSQKPRRSTRQKSSNASEMSRKSSLACAERYAFNSFMNHRQRKSHSWKSIRGLAADIRSPTPQAAISRDGSSKTPLGYPRRQTKTGCAISSCCDTINRAISRGDAKYIAIMRV